MSSHRREENSVTEMSGSDEIARSWHGPENRQIIGCSRTQSRPSLKYACSTQSRNQMKRRPVHLFNRSGIGATVEEAGFDKRTDPATIEQMHRAALHLIPALGRARILEAWAGLRPGTPDNLPILGPCQLRAISSLP